jgi:mono/diheme cytochrome c family protein
MKNEKRQSQPGERRRLFFAFFILNFALVGCYRQEMARQPKYRWPDLRSGFFADGHVDRPIEPGTVARGELEDDSTRFTGLVGPGRPDAPDYATEFPYVVDEPMLKRGRERFNIYCAVCHGRTGYADGMIVQRGYLKPPSYHEKRLREMPVGRMFQVITRGYGGMPDYAGQVPVDDRWAIVAYIRVLQYSQNAPAADLTDENRLKLKETEKKSGD